MKPNRLMQERIRRVTVLFRELGFDVGDGQTSDESFTATFRIGDKFQGDVVVDADSKFLELAFSFSFSAGMGDFVRERIEEVMHALYEYGCYFSLQVDDQDINLTVFSKIYFAGLNYFALKETVRDFREAVEATEQIFDIQLESEGEGDGEDT